MPLVSVIPDNPFLDGRQSSRALTVRNGVERFFTEIGSVTLTEWTLPNGRRADIAALCPKGLITIIEIKSSLADLKADSKWPDYFDYCDALIFATLADVPADSFPPEAGFMVADDYGAALLREPGISKINAARRKSLHLSFARTSAQRLARCCAHAGIDSADLD